MNRLAGAAREWDSMPGGIISNYHYRLTSKPVFITCFPCAAVTVKRFKQAKIRNWELSNTQNCGNTWQSPQARREFREDKFVSDSARLVGWIWSGQAAGMEVTWMGRGTFACLHWACLLSCIDCEEQKNSIKKKSCTFEFLFGEHFHLHIVSIWLIGKYAALLAGVLMEFVSPLCYQFFCVLAVKVRLLVRFCFLLCL